MRKNKVDRAYIVGIKSTYEISGLNLDRLINTLKNRGVTLYNVKKYGNKRLVVSVNLLDRRKFFAITKELCYNIKKVRDGGKAYPLLAIYRSLGIFIGAIIISLSAYYFDGIIFSFSFSGNGSIYEREVREYLYGCGIKKFTRFANVDLSRLEDSILSNNRHLSFVSCQKSGNSLNIKLVLSTDDVERLNGNVYSLYSQVDGVIESIKVYRGTALVNVNDKVQKGDLLVDGIAVIKEQTVKINVLCSVSVIAQTSFEYKFNSAGQEEKALLFAERDAEDFNVIDSLVSVKEVDGEFIYLVTVKHRFVMRAG